MSAATTQHTMHVPTAATAIAFRRGCRCPMRARSSPLLESWPGREENVSHVCRNGPSGDARSSNVFRDGSPDSRPACAVVVEAISGASGKTVLTNSKGVRTVVASAGDREAPFRTMPDEATIVPRRARDSETALREAVQRAWRRGWRWNCWIFEAVIAACRQHRVSPEAAPVSHRIWPRVPSPNYARR